MNRRHEHYRRQQLYWTTERTTVDDEPVRLAVDMAHGQPQAFRLNDFGP
jgi:hypothetical protein